MTRPETKGFQKPIKSQSGKVNIAFLRMVSGDGGFGFHCNCGTKKYHRRRKVVETQADKHVNEKHGGQAIWL